MHIRKWLTILIPLLIGIGIILSAIFMYLLAKEIFGEIGGIISSVAYIFAPYHSVDIYVRGAFPEFWSFVFLPLIFFRNEVNVLINLLATFFMANSASTFFSLALVNAQAGVLLADDHCIGVPELHFL